MAGAVLAALGSGRVRRGEGALVAEGFTAYRFAVEATSSLRGAITADPEDTDGGGGGGGSGGGGGGAAEAPEGWRFGLAIL